MKSNKPISSAVVQLALERPALFNEMARISSAFQIPEAYTSAIARQQSVVSEFTKWNNIVPREAFQISSTASSILSSLDSIRRQQKLMHDMMKSQIPDMAAPIAKVISSYQLDKLTYWKTSFDYLSNLHTEDREQLADFVIQEVPVLEDEYAGSVPDLSEEDLVRFRDLFPRLKNFPAKEFQDFLTRVIAIISIALSIKASLDADTAHQDAIQLIKTPFKLIRISWTPKRLPSTSK